MVAVFQTNVQHKECADKIVRSLHEQFPLLRVNFDLDDCDKILRAEGLEIDKTEIISVVSTMNYHCLELRD